MELQQFIEKTIRDVSISLHNSNESMIKDQYGKGIEDRHAMMVEFDIAVTVTQGNANDLGGKITVMGIEIGGGKKKELHSESVSRIKFAVPLRLKTLEQKIGPIVA